MTISLPSFISHYTSDNRNSINLEYNKKIEPETSGFLELLQWITTGKSSITKGITLPHDEKLQQEFIKSSN